MRQLVRIIALSLLLVATTYAEIRTWTDIQGRTMEAEFVRLQGDRVAFQKADGMRYSFSLARLSQADKDHIKTLITAPSLNTAKDSTELAPTDLTQWLEKHLVIRKGTRVSRHRESRLPQAEYIALYFSASWCPPCRTFTPKLVNFYNEHSASNSNFELIFVSSDRDEDGMESYIVDYEMPWPSLEFDETRDKRIRQFAGSGIPCLVIVDREGSVMQHSYVNGKYRGPTSVLNKLDEWLDE